VNTRLPAVRPRALLAAPIALLLVVAGLIAGPTAANAAPGDVAAATLQWGFKQSFRNYISGPIAHGGWTVDGVDDTTPFAWSGGAGTADQAGATGWVNYGGSIHFTGHEGMGVPTGSYALDLTISNVRVQQTSAGAATIVVDTRSNSLADPLTFVDSLDVPFATVDLASATNASDATTVAYSGAPSVLTAEGAAAFSGFYGAGTALDPVAFFWPVEQAPPPPAPSITVSQTTDISPAGEFVTVTGTGFLPDAPATNATRPPLAGKFGGAYVTFGKFAEVWKPSAGAPSSARKVGTQLWAVSPEDAAGLGPTAIAINADGSFTAQLLVKPGFGEPGTGNYGVYTYGGGGSNYAPYETYTPISFSTARTISVSKTTDLNPLGETVTVTGWNFTPAPPQTTGTRPPLSGKFGGAYVVFGKFADTWKPSVGALGASRKVDSQQWAMSAADSATIGAGTVALDDKGGFTLQLQVRRDFPNEPATGNYGIYTYSGSGAAYAAFETATPLTFTPATPTTLALAATPASGLIDGATPKLTATVAPAVDGTVTFTEGTTVLGSADTSAGVASISSPALSAGSHTIAAAFVPDSPLLYSSSTATLVLEVGAKPVAAGSLTWGIKQSFREYVVSSIAHGSITTNGAGTSGGQFIFGQALGGTYTESAGVGTSAYSGSVRFLGHSGVLDVTIGNPVVSIESASRATLYVSVNGGGSTPFAVLNLAAGIRSTSGNTVAYSGVPASLTSAGAAVFSYNGSNFYSAGTALDAVSFVIGSPSAVGGGVRTISAYAGPKEPATTPPATTGIVVDAASLKNLVAGGEITFTADGFEPNETGILVVIYSDPIVLARDLVADAAGTVTWTGRLPAGLAGTHTLTVQGSVDRGVVLTIPARVATAADGCPVDASSLTWGFKESFRSYISGSIANGEWTVANGATYETPDFGFADGDGAYDAESEEGLVRFEGAISFTGHGGILNTTVSNPQVRFVDGETAVLLLDVSGTTQEGAVIDQREVEFVELDLTGVVEFANDVLTVDGAPAVLLPAGAEAFGTYEAGEEFDPVFLELELDPSCAEIAAAPTEVSAEPASAEGPTAWWVLWLIGGLLILALTVVVVVTVRRRAA
jgi:hypothetical protein